MTYVVNESYIRCKAVDCVDVCPVDCFYEGQNMLVIHPDECIDCGVCGAAKKEAPPGNWAYRTCARGRWGARPASAHLKDSRGNTPATEGLQAALPPGGWKDELGWSENTSVFPGVVKADVAQDLRWRDAQSTRNRRRGDRMTG